VSNPLPRTVIIVPDGLRPVDWLSASRGVPDDGGAVVTATAVVGDAVVGEAAVGEAAVGEAVVGATSDVLDATVVGATNDVVTSAGASLVAS